MKGFGKLIGRALSYSSQQTQLKPLTSRRRLIHAASSSAATTSYLDNKTTSSSSYSSPLRSSPIPSLHSRRKWAGPFGEEDDVYTNAVHTESCLPDVLLREAGYGFWQRRLSQCVLNIADASMKT